jgi:hypothetical protein
MPVRTDGPENSLERHLELGLPMSDLVLLCSFGPDLGGERTSKQLRSALLTAGFAGPVAGYLIRVSPLLRRSSRRGYRLREFQL